MLWHQHAAYAWGVARHLRAIEGDVVGLAEILAADLDINRCRLAEVDHPHPDEPPIGSRRYTAADPSQLAHAVHVFVAALADASPSGSLDDGCAGRSILRVIDRRGKFGRDSECSRRSKSRSSAFCTSARADLFHLLDQFLRLHGGARSASLEIDCRLPGSVRGK